MILLIDNYDSFTYNLVQYFQELGSKLKVYRNDKITFSEIKKLKGITHIVISPGPGTPKDAGISKDLIKEYAGKLPILGVCLGHQCIGEVFGGRIIQSKKLMHGKTSLIYHNKKDIFKNIKNPFDATRYHSLVVQRKSLPKCFNIIAYTKDSQIMGIKHKDFLVYGVQFHPESIITKEGKKLLKNFISIRRGK